MSEAKPKIEGAKKFHRTMTAAGPQIKKEFIAKVLGLENHTLDIGNVECASKYKKTVNAIANHIQREYRWGRHLKGNQKVEPSNSVSTRVPEGKDCGDRCRPRGYIDPATGHHHGKEENCPN
jgi:hypothetical protein